MRVIKTFLDRMLEKYIHTPLLDILVLFLYFFNVPFHCHVSSEEEEKELIIHYGGWSSTHHVFSVSSMIAGEG